MNQNSGGRAERAVADYLVELGYKIIATNWKTKWCEIDLIAKKDKIIYFVEVKYRANDEQGSGFDYITNSKLNQMKKAADIWVHNNEYGGEYVLSAAEVSGNDYSVNFIEEL